MKKSTLITAAIFAYCILHTAYCFSQGTAINTTGAAADSSAMLDVSGDKGVLISRMTTSVRNAITSPAEGLMIFNTSTKCLEMYVNGAWNTASCPAACNPPPAPVAAAASGIDCSVFTANWASSAGATSYYLDVASDAGFTGFVAGYININVGNMTYSNITGLSAGTDYYYRVRASSICASGNSNTIGPVTTLSVTTAPAAGVNVPGSNQIEWNWNSVSGAAGYKWNTVNNYAGAVDMGTNTTKTETGLACNTSYTRYVWAYNLCGASVETELNDMTGDCSIIFSYTGSDQYFTVPQGINTVTVKLWGAGGAGAANTCPNCSEGGGGGYSTGDISVGSGETLTVIVGQGGVVQGTGITYGGGGGGDFWRGSGGGRSAIRQNSSEIITAAGGGAGGCSNSSLSLRGGAGGGLSGQDGEGDDSGKGGTQSAGGSGSTCPGSNPGTQFQGGSNWAGGGGGYYGGGSSGDCGPTAPGAGGGSSYLDSGLSNAYTTGGNYASPGNYSDSDRNGAGQGGAVYTNGANGIILISW